MADLRQRKGEGKEAKEQSGMLDGPSKEQSTKEMFDHLVTKLRESKPKHVPGRSQDVVEAKEKLDQNPYSMECIFDLGRAYVQDGHWDKAAIVLMRGWKRVEEIEDEGLRLQFLVMLAEASLKDKKAKQALAVMNSISSVPDDQEALQHFDMMRCRIYCANNDVQNGLQALKKAIDGESFTKASAMWASALGPLKQCGAYDLSKSHMLGLCQDDTDKDRLKAMESLLQLKEEIHREDAPPTTGKMKKAALWTMFVVWLVYLFWMLYDMETKSLASITNNK